MPTSYQLGPSAVKPAPRDVFLPGCVRRCENLCPNAKALYADIRALAVRSGHCFATNKHFAQVFDVTTRTVRRWLAALEQWGFISVQVQRGNGTWRRIYVTERLAPPPPPARSAPPRSSEGGEDISVPQSSAKQNSKQSESGKTFNAGGRKWSLRPLRDAESLQQVTKVTGDSHSIRRFAQLRRICESSGRQSDWEAALEAVRKRLDQAAEPLHRPGAYFCAVLKSLLNAQSVYVPCGTHAERAQVQQLIRQSLQAAQIQE